VTEGAFAISQSYAYFPNKTIHVVVIDPGVGSSRRPLLVEMAGQYFIAPDNGVLSMVYSRETHKVRHITADRYFRQPVSRTFHGRDIFSPVAAHLATGVAATRFGKLIQDYVRLSLDQPVQTGKRTWTGTVLRADRFGNLITNFHIEAFPAMGAKPFEIGIGLEKLTRLAQTFSDGGLGELMVITGSSGFLEVTANQASAAKLLGCAAGSPVELTLFP
jgi:S-adenosylmethionine hydrolase